MRYLVLIRPLTLMALLTLFGCGGRTSTPETATPAEAARDTATTLQTPSPSAPNTVPQEPVPQPTTKRASESRPVAPKPAVPQGQPVTTPEPQPIVVDAGTAIEVTVDQTLSSKTNS